MQLSKLSCAAAFVAVAASTISAQTSRNVTLLSRFDPGGSFSDVWGYVEESTGREFALLLGRSRTYIVETTNPRSPSLKGSFAGASSTWRDARTYRGYAYVVTEGAGGMQIIDLRNPDAPRLVKTWTGGLNWNNTHNIALDTSTGLAYPCGTSGGMHILDLSQDPENPRYVTTYSFQYVHDLQIQDGYAYLAEINRSTFRILDVRNLPSQPRLGSASVRTCHNAWPTRDNNYVVTTSERSGEPIRFFDVRNRNAPRLIASWRTGGSRSLPHNAYIRERVVHASYYGEGYRILDLTNPASPLEVGFIDTSSCWGAYPFQPSGVCYASDINNGLYIFKPRAVTERYGQGTPGTGSEAPTVHAFGAAYLGNSAFGLEVSGAPANANAFFLVGAARQNTVFQGLTLLVDTTIGGIITGAADSSGNGRVPLSVPTTANLNGQQVHAQCIVADPNGPNGFAASGAITIDLFNR